MGDESIRQAGRVLLVDAADRVLLFSGRDPHHPDDELFWFTPGGGLDPGETHRQGALRELFEETGLSGISEAELGPAVWERDATFEFESVHYRQHELFFLLRVVDHVVDVSGFTDLERRSVHAHRWWSMAELAATDEVVFPSSLAAELAALLRDGPPPSPRRVASDDAG